MPTKYSFMIGPDENNLTNIEELGSLGLQAPYYAYKPFQEGVEAVDGNIKGLGLPSLLWRWSSITLTQRDYLRANLCTGESAAIAIASLTPESSGAYTTFTGILVWPEEEIVENESVVDFQLLFKNLVEVSYP